MPKLSVLWCFLRQYSLSVLVLFVELEGDFLELIVCIYGDAAGKVRRQLDQDINVLSVFETFVKPDFCID